MYVVSQIKMSQIRNNNKNQNNQLRVAHINIRSIIPKINKIRDYIYGNNLDILAVSETWLTHAISDELVSVNGFRLVRKDRAAERGGGVLIFVRNTINFKEISNNKCDFAEQIWIEFKIKKIKTIFGVIYRRPGYESVHDFFGEFEENICKNLLNCNNLICTGDFNINILNLHCIHTQRLLMIFTAYSLTQVISEPTRQGPNSATLIDLILCSNMDLVQNSAVDHTFDASDHFLIKCQLKLESLKPQPFFATYRDFRHFDRAAFYRDLQNVPFDDIYYMPNIDQKVNTFNFYLLELFNLHAPLRTSRITKRKAPWLTPNIKFFISLRNKTLSKYKRQRTATNWESYRQLRNFVSNAIDREKRAYLENRIQNNGSRDNWKLLNELDIYSKTKKVVPEHLGNADTINNFFLSAAQSGVPGLETLNFYRSHKREGVTSFLFRMARIEDVEKAISSIKSEAIGCDGIGIKMLMYCCPYILPVVIHMINFCIETHDFPECWKTSYVLPFPKVTSPNELKDLRPISILPTLSKVIERILESQVRDYVVHHNILPAVQSGFRRGYSCATALLKVVDDILEASDRGDLTALVLLDYSKAFDSLNHDLLLSILNYLGFDDDSLLLVKAYLSGRRQMVKLSGNLSNPERVPCGVPQGSILGPLFFSLYTSQLITYLRYSTAHFYADDTQLYLSFKPDKILEANVKLMHDLNALEKASEAHCLRINPTKSQVLLFGRTQSRNQGQNLLHISLNNENMNICTTARNLGLLLDTDLRFSGHVNNCIKRAFANLKLIYSQRTLLNEGLRKVLCDSIVLSHFNYCDVLYGPCLLECDARRIQLMQNSCVRLIGGIRGRERGVSAKLREIHWLRMNERRMLHSLILFNKIICNRCPDYLYDKVKFRYDAHNLEIRHKYMITPPAHLTSMYERSFSYQVSKIYNKVPINFKNVSGYKFNLFAKKNIDNFL